MPKGAEAAQPVTTRADYYPQLARIFAQPKTRWECEVVHTDFGAQQPTVVNQYGKGKVICVGALAGLAYLRPAMNESVHEFPTEFPSGLRDLITTPVRLAHVTSPIEASDPLVEAQFMTGPERTVAVLINWRQEPIDDLVVRFPGRTRVKAVRSLRRAGFFKGHLDEQRQGALEVTLKNDVPRVRMQLEVTDYLLID